MLVEVAVSSINTSRAGSNGPCSRINAAVRATSARSSAARNFFDADFTFAAEKSATPRCGCRRSVACASPRRFHRVSDPICRAISTNKKTACASSGEMLPPLGFGAMLPVACRRCIHLTAGLGLTSNHSAASRRDAPDSAASTTRRRNSRSMASALMPSRIQINATTFAYPNLPGNPDSPSRNPLNSTCRIAALTTTMGRRPRWICYGARNSDRVDRRARTA